MSDLPDPIPFSLPYADILPRLIDSVYFALAELCGDRSDHVSDRDISKHFLWMEKDRSRGTDEHLFMCPDQEKSLRIFDKKNLPSETRIGQLVITTFRRVDEMLRRSQTSGVLLPSPLRIVIDFLTDPDEPASRAFAFATVRAYLMERMGLTVSLSGMADNSNDSLITIANVEDAIRTVGVYLHGRDNLSPPRKDPGKHFVYQLLAISGVLNFRFPDTGARQRFLNQKILVEYSDPDFEFRVGADIEKIPNVSGVINQIWGLPLPIRGADTVFYGGLRFATDGGLVVAITGQPGSGKTSLGLYLAITLAPLGAKTFFVTAEEHINDLAFRLATLTPEYLRRLSLYDSNTGNWFRAYRMPSPAGGSRHCDLMNVLHQLTEIRAQTRAAAQNGGKNHVCPFIVVLDGIQNYFIRDYTGGDFQEGNKDAREYGLDTFIAECRRLGALVILTCADKQKELQPLEYLSDMVLDLEYNYTDEIAIKPVRYLLLRKSRHQLSRPGAHICHISGSSGFRMAPQLASQVDQRAVFRVQEPDKNRWIDALNRPLIGNPDKVKKPKYSDYRVDDSYLQLFNRSHILVHGRGSTGKAGFGLTLLASPRICKDRTDGDPYLQENTLIISFLYPENYYKELNKRIIANIRTQYSNSNYNHKIDVLHFTPGYLNPEDLLSKIGRRLQRAELAGEPFTGVLIDGLHNTFLQFPRLEQNQMIWPMLYTMLRRQNVTVVSTHTAFSLSNMSDPFREDPEISMRRATPLLHALVQAADFYLIIESNGREYIDESETAGGDEISVRAATAFGQPIPQEERYWHRERLIVYDYLGQLELPMPLPRKAKVREDGVKKGPTLLDISDPSPDK